MQSGHDSAWNTDRNAARSVFARYPELNKRSLTVTREDGGRAWNGPTSFGQPHCFANVLKRGTHLLCELFDEDSLGKELADLNVDTRTGLDEPLVI